MQEDYQDEDSSEDDEGCILSDKEGFEFLIANKDEWIDSFKKCLVWSNI